MRNIQEKQGEREKDRDVVTDTEGAQPDGAVTRSCHLSNIGRGGTLLGNGNGPGH